MSTLTEKYAEQYVDLPLTKFPVAEDEIDRMMDINSTLIESVNQYNRYLSEGNYSSAIQMVADNPDLMKCFFNADKFNVIRDAIIALERYEMTQVEELYERIARDTVGINDDPTEEEAAVNAYSGQKVNELLRQLEDKYHHQWQVTIPADGWSAVYPFTNTVSGVEGMTADTNVHLVGLYVPPGAELDQVQDWNRAIGFLMSNTEETATGEGTVTFLAYKKPESDFTVVLEGGPAAQAE